MRDTPSNNPLDNQSPPELERDAENFWKYHNLREHVSKEEFVLGVLAFVDMPNTMQEIENIENEEASAGSSNAQPNPRSLPRHGLNKLKDLNFQQRESIKKYAVHLEYPIEENVIKRWCIWFIEQMLRLWRKKRPLARITSTYREKSAWDHMRTLSRAHMTVLAMCALSAITQGWDQSSMSGANIEWPLKFLNSPINFFSAAPDSTFLIFGWLNAAPFFTGALVGCLLSDPFINEGALGRRWAITFAGIFSLASVIGAAFTKSWQAFMVCRLLLGIGMGGKASAVPIFIAEIAPEEIRGMLTMCWQLFDTCGIFLGAAANLAVFRRNPNDPDWRFMIALPFIPALMFLTLILFCEESPRWLLKRGKMVGALQTLIHLHDLPTPIVACGDLYQTFRRLQDEEEVYMREAGSSKKFKKWMEKRREQRERKMRTDPAPGDAATAYELQQSSNGTARRLAATNGPRAQIDSTDVGIGPGTNVQGTASSAANQDSDDISPAPASNAIPAHSNEHVAPNIRQEPLKVQELLMTGILERLHILYRLPRTRNAVYASVCVMSAQQFCGINILAFMSSTIFANLTQGGSLDAPSKQKVLEFSLWFGLINFLFTFFAFPMIDWKGRRWLLNLSFPAMAVCLLFSGGVLQLPEDNQYRKRVFEAFTLIFTACFSVGEGPAAFVISSEVFPLIVRELGMSHAVFWNFLWASFLSFLIPIMAKGMTRGWFWILFGLFNLIFWRLCYIFVPETETESLENIYHKIYEKSKWEMVYKMPEIRLFYRVTGKLKEVRGIGSRTAGFQATAT